MRQLNWSQIHNADFITRKRQRSFTSKIISYNHIKQSYNYEIKMLPIFIVGNLLWDLRIPNK